MAFDPFAYDPIAQHMRSRPRQEWRRPASDEALEEQGSSMLHKGLSGLAYVGSLMNKPGRTIRGVLDAATGGKGARELPAIIPFSDTLGLTKPENEVTGAQLNKKLFGVRDDNSWKSWGAGLATELATDPLMLVGGVGPRGAKTALGSLASKLGETRGLTGLQMAKGFEHTVPELKAAGANVVHEARKGATIGSENLVNQATAKGLTATPGAPLSGLLRLQVPFMPDASVTLGAGRPAEAVAKLTGAAGDFLKYQVPGMKTLSSWFDPAVRGATTTAGQQAARMGAKNFERAGTVERGMDFALRDKIHGLIKEGASHPTAPWTKDEALRALRMHGEGILPSSVLPVNPELWKATQGLGGDLGNLRHRYLEESHALGLPQGDLRDPFTLYMHRMGIKPQAQNAQMRPRNILPTGHGSMVQRKNWVTGIPGGTTMLEQWAQNPALTGVARTLAPVDVTAQVLKDMIAQANAQGIRLPDLLKEKIVNGALVKKTLTHEQQLAAKARQVAKQLGRREEYGPIFNPSISASQELRELRHGTATAGAETAYQSLGAMAKPMGRGMVPLPKVASQLGLKTTEGGKLGLQGANVELHKAAARHGLPFTEDFIDQLMVPVHAATTPQDAQKAIAAAQAQLRHEVGRFGVTQEQAAALTKDNVRWSTPEELAAPKNAWNSFTNAFRKLAYSAWLPSHVRNMLSSEVMTATGTGPHLEQRLAGRVLGGTATASELAGVHGVPVGLPDEMARKSLMESAHAHAKLGINAHQEAEIAGGIPAGRTRTPELPGTGPPIPNALLHMAKGAYQTGNDIRKFFRHPFSTANPLEMQGVGKGLKDFPLVQAGHEVGTKVENRVRLGQFIDLLKRGYDPAEAGRQVLATHFDYSSLTPFERHVMRPLFPFYTFMSRNLPRQLEMAVQRPGITSSQLRLAAGQRNEFVPQHLASGVAIPTGDEHGGNQQYVSQLGIPIEEAFERFKIHGGDPLASLRDTVMAYAGGLNPLIKGPLEQLSNTQFFSGRKLSDLRPQGTVGTAASFLDPDSRHRDLTNLVAQGLANTPATRFLTMVDKMQDPRKSLPIKALNLLTGVRVSDVDMEKTRAIELRRALEQGLEANPNISSHMNLYVKPEDQAKLTPADIEQLQALSRLEAQAQRVAKEKRRGSA